MKLKSGEVVEAYRTRRSVHGVERDVVRRHAGLLHDAGRRLAHGLHGALEDRRAVEVPDRVAERNAAVGVPAPHATHAEYRTRLGVGGYLAVRAGRMGAGRRLGWHVSVDAARVTGARSIIVAGGVSANRRLRETFLGQKEFPVHIPPLWLCTDNAAMIAWVGARRLARGERAEAELDAAASLEASGLPLH